MDYGSFRFLYRAAFAAVVLIFCVFHGPLRAENPQASAAPQNEDFFAALLKNMYPPEVRDVTLAPQAPTADRPTTVRAAILNDPNKSDDETVRSWMMYSADGGGEWETAEMARLGDKTTWTADLPPFPRKTEVLLGFRAEDTSGNVYAETPCLVRTWPPEGDPCMFELADDAEPADGDSSEIQNDSDILAVRAGVDEENLFFEIEFQDRIASGTATPLFAGAYGVAVRNPDTGNPTDLTTQGFVAVWIPLAEAAGRPGCVIIRKQKEDLIFDAKFIECMTDGGSRLWFRIGKRAIGDNPSRYVKTVAAAGAFTNFDPPDGIIRDRTPVSTIRFRDRRFTVK